MFFIHTYVDEHLGGFHVLPIVNNVAMMMSVEIILLNWYFYFMWMIAGSYGTCI